MILRLLLAAILAWPSVSFAKEEAPAASAEEGKGLPEWVDLQQKLLVLKSKISASEKTVKDLIAAKSKEKDPQKSRELVGSLQLEYQTLRNQIEEYEKVRGLLKYRFPEKGMKDSRKYERIETRSLEQMEIEVGLQGKIRSAVGRVRQQYGAAASKPADQDQSNETKPSANQAPQQDKGASRVLEPANLSK